MIQNNTSGNVPDAHPTNRIDLIYGIARSQYGRIPPRLPELFFDVTELFHGRWPSHESCQTGYHNLEHALDVALAAARMAAGLNMACERCSIPEDIFLDLISAAFFHDAGYIKAKGDNEGRGGKFTFNHVDRGMEIAQGYLSQKGWPARSVRLVSTLIEVTEFYREPELAGMFSRDMEEAAAKILATADLIAQVADVDYLNRVTDLYEEFSEAYEVEDRQALSERGIHVFNSAQELLDGTVSFYEDFVLPRLELLGRMDKYLINFFGNGRNPYRENISANLSNSGVTKERVWRRLGEILTEPGAVSPARISEALERQQIRKRTPEDTVRPFHRSIRNRLIGWVNRQSLGNYLGDILLEMKAVNPSLLRLALLDQILPESLIEELSKDELLGLLNISLILQYSHKGPWVCDQVLEMTNELLGCEVSSIFLVNPEEQQMEVLLSSSPDFKAGGGKKMPIDKGLPGWVFRKDMATLVPSVHLDERFAGELIPGGGFETRSVLAVPLHINGECIGVIEAVNKKAGDFAEHDMNLLVLLANVMAISLSGALCLQESYF